MSTKDSGKLPEQANIVRSLGGFLRRENSRCHQIIILLTWQETAKMITTWVSKKQVGTMPLPSEYPVQTPAGTLSSPGKNIIILYPLLYPYTETLCNYLVRTTLQVLPQTRTFANPKKGTQDSHCSGGEDVLHSCVLLRSELVATL